MQTTNFKESKLISSWRNAPRNKNCPVCHSSELFSYHSHRIIENCYDFMKWCGKCGYKKILYNVWGAAKPFPCPCLEERKNLPAYNYIRIGGEEFPFYAHSIQIDNGTIWIDNSIFKQNATDLIQIVRKGLIWEYDCSQSIEIEWRE